MNKNRGSLALFLLIILVDQALKIVSTKGLFTFSEVIYTTERGFLISIVIPSIAIILLLISLFRVKNYSNIQRFALWGLSAGVTTNTIDRVCRSFKSIKYFSLNLFQYSTTLNIGDIAVVICTTIVIISLVIQDKGQLYN